MNYKLIGYDLYDYRSQKIAIVKGTDIYNTHSQKVGTYRNNDVFDDRYQRMCSVRGDDIFDEHNTRIGSLNEIKRQVDGAQANMLLAALWWFFIKEA